MPVQAGDEKQSAAASARSSERFIRSPSIGGGATQVAIEEESQPISCLGWDPPRLGEYRVPEPVLASAAALAAEARDHAPQDLPCMGDVPGHDREDGLDRD